MDILLVSAVWISNMYLHVWAMGEKAFKQYYNFDIFIGYIFVIYVSSSLHAVRAFGVEDYKSR